MNRSLRYAYFPAFAAGLTLAVRLFGADMAPPSPTTVAAGGAAAAPAVAPTPTPTPRLPKALEGVVDQDEFTAYIKFVQGLKEDPEIKALNDEIRGKMAEMTALQKKVQAAQLKALAAHPDIQAIVDKIKKGRPKPPVVQAPSPTPKPSPTATPK